MIPAQYLDIPGFLLFVLLLITGISILKREKVAAWIVIGVAVLGLIADGYSLITNFVLRLT